MELCGEVKYLVKDFIGPDLNERVCFSKEEFTRAKTFMQNLPNSITSDGGICYSTPRAYKVGFSTGEWQVQLEEVDIGVVKQLIEILNPKYFLDSMAKRSPISELNL